MLSILNQKYGEDFSWYELSEVSTQKHALEEELEKELEPVHDLFGKKLNAVATNERNDDVLFYDSKNYYLIHLTWAKGTRKYPQYKKINSENIISYIENDYLYG